MWGSLNPLVKATVLSGILFGLLAFFLDGGPIASIPIFIGSFLAFRGSKFSSLAFFIGSLAIFLLGVGHYMGDGELDTLDLVSALTVTLFISIPLILSIMARRYQGGAGLSAGTQVASPNVSSPPTQATPFTPVGSPSETTSEPVSQRLRRLETLKDEGMLSDAEYQKRRERILDEI